MDLETLSHLTAELAVRWFDGGLSFGFNRYFLSFILR